MRTGKIKYNNIFISLLPLKTISQIFGLMPMKLGKQNSSLIVSKLSQVYSCLLIFIFLIHFLTIPLYIIHVSFSDDPETSNVIDSITYIIDNLKGDNIGKEDYSNTIPLAMKIMSTVSLNLMGMSARYISLIKTPSEFPKIINDLHEADAFLKKHFPTNYNFVSKKRFYDSSLLLLFVMTLTALFNFSYIYMVWMKWGLSFTLIWCALLALASLTGCIMELQFTNFSISLKLRFEMLNEGITALISDYNKTNLFHG